MRPRDRSLRALAAASLLLGASAGLGALTAPSAGAATALNAANFRLAKSAANPVIPKLDAALPNVSVGAVVDSANRTGARCAPNAAHLLTAFCWNSGDNTTTDWYPQGITTSADADPSGTVDGRSIVVASWYDHNTASPQKGARVSFVNLANPAAPAYRHVLLVVPYTNAAGQPDFRSVGSLHTGGIAWYGPYLYVADTSNGYRVFDTRHLWKVTTGDKSKIGRQSDGTYQAFDYAYVLPQAFTYTHSTTGGYAKLRWSFTSLDRTSSPDSLVAGEWSSAGTGTRLARFPLDESSHLLAVSSDGYVHGTQAYQVDVTSMQGAASIDGTYYLSTSDGSGNRGDLATYVPGGTVKISYDTLPIGPEDLSYRSDTGALWSLCEYPGSRAVYALDASAYRP